MSGNTNNTVFIQNFFTSRDNFVDGNVQEALANTASYVGQQGRLWWDPARNSLFASDGNTAGGIPVVLANSANISINQLTANTGTINGNLTVTGNISPAAVGKIGGVQPGPGVVIVTTGILTVDGANLPVSFGNFFANNNILSIVNIDENMILETQGNAAIQLVGNVGFYKLDGSSPTGQYLSATNDGIITIKVTAVGNQGAFNIIGSTTGNEISPGQTGAMMHITGQLADPCRIYFDGNDNYVSLVARRWNGNVAIPTQVLAGEDVLRINSTAATDVGVGNVGMAQIRTTALENQTSTAQGSSITFTVTPIGSPASARVDVANITVANGLSAIKFTGNLIGNVTGNVTGTAATVTTAAQPNITSVGTLTSLAVTGNISGANVTATHYGAATGLTGIPGANVTGTVANATYATSAGTAGTVTTNAQPNITSVGTLTSLAVTGNITTGNLSGANLITSNFFSGSGNLLSNIQGANVTGAVSTATTATNLTAASSILAGTFSLAVNVGKNSLTTLTQTITGLTTSHKVIITPATVMPDNQSGFGAAWASSTNTLSIQFSNPGGAVNTSFNISYFAFV